MRNLIALTKYQFALLLRNKQVLLITILMPLVMFLVFGTLMDDNIIIDGVPLANYFIPSFTLIIVVNILILQYGYFYVRMREIGAFTRFKLLGVSPIISSIATFIPLLVLELIAIAILIVTGYLYKSIVIPFDRLHTIFFILILINLMQFAMVYLVTAFVKNGGTYQGISNILFNVQMFAGGLTFPEELFPDFVLKIAKIFLPILYGVRVMKGVWVHGESLLSYRTELLILSGVTVALLIVGTLARRNEKLN